jgi:quercetin dioxygenase-like cupin family protein
MMDGPAGRPRAASIRASDGHPFGRGPGVQTLHLATPGIGARELLTGITMIDAGAGVPLHAHNCEEAVVVLEGVAAFEAEGDESRLGAGDATWTPPGVVHGFSNPGPGRLRIYWAYGSVDATRTVAATGLTTRIASEPQRAGEQAPTASHAGSADLTA